MTSTYLGFTDGDTDELGTHVGKQSEDEGIDETAKLAEITGLLVGLESPAVGPVPESNSLLARNTSEVDNETEEDEAREGDDLDE